MARRYKHSLEEIKAMVLRSAEKIVIEEGYQSLNARKIAMDIGYTAGSIYMVFDSMTDLICHINAHTLDEIITHLNQSQQIQPDIALEELVTHYCRYANNNLNRWRLLFSSHLPPNSSVPEWYQQYADQSFSKIAILFVTALPKRNDIDNDLVVQVLWASINGIYTASLSNTLGAINGKNHHVENGMRLLIDHFVSGWLSKATS